MKAVIRLYYLLGIFFGGFRHYAFEWSLFSRFSNIGNPGESPVFMVAAEYVLLGLFLIALFFPFLKQVHLAVFSLLFLSDVLFQNFVKHESSVIVTHLFPLFCYIFLRVGDKAGAKNRAYQAAVLLLSLGFVTSLLSKCLNGWFSPGHRVVQGYLIEMNRAFGIDYYLSRFFVSVRSAFFWKAVDYGVLLFEAAFIVNFFTLRFHRLFFAWAVVFHILILLVLDIGVFYPQILFYALILAYGGQTAPWKEQRASYSKRGVFAAACLLLGAAFYVYRKPQFFAEMLPDVFYVHMELIANVLALICFFWTYVRNLRKDTYIGFRKNLADHYV